MWKQQTREGEIERGGESNPNINQANAADAWKGACEAIQLGVFLNMTLFSKHRKDRNILASLRFGG